MTNEQINIAIAEACGWKLHPQDRWIVIPPNSQHSVQPLSTIPNYCNDLNAMHEAEKSLAHDIRNHYIDLLGETYSDSWEFATATARQRAEAFLKTIGKWEGKK